MRKTGATSKDFKEYSYCYVIFIKSTVYVYRTTFSTIICTFLGEGRGGGGGGRLLNILALGGAIIRRGVLIWSWALIRAFTVS